MIRMFLEKRRAWIDAFDLDDERNMEIGFKVYYLREQRRMIKNILGNY
jgi:hypothetical protein